MLINVDVFQNFDELITNYQQFCDEKQKRILLGKQQKCMEEVGQPMLRIDRWSHFLPCIWKC